MIAQDEFTFSSQDGFSGVLDTNITARQAEPASRMLTAVDSDYTTTHGIQPYPHARVRPRFRAGIMIRSPASEPPELHRGIYLQAGQNPREAERPHVFGEIEEVRGVTAAARNAAPRQIHMTTHPLPRLLCPYCVEYDGTGHNFCRMCGSHLAAGQQPRPEVHKPHHPSEKYCGECGRERSLCEGKHGG
jgi:hypothetical protein